MVLAGGQGATYQYDLNGNLTAGDSANPLVGELRVHYDAYNKPFRTQRNGHFSEFWYGADDQRYFQRDSQGLETVYVGKLYEQKGPTKHQLYLGGYAVFTVDITDPSATGLTYLHGDRLGSVVEMSNASGQLISDGARGFDPFGKPREGDWSNSNHNDAAGGSVLLPNDLNRPDLTTRGFTGHEQLNNVALTHMNGRAYDYNLGRFLSVDPVIQFPTNSQSLNPYSYILNNPLAGTDPTGYTVDCNSTRPMSGCQPTMPEIMGEMPAPETDNGKETGGEQGKDGNNEIGQTSDRDLVPDQTRQEEPVELPPVVVKEGVVPASPQNLSALLMLATYITLASTDLDDPKPQSNAVQTVVIITAIATTLYAANEVRKMRESNVANNVSSEEGDAEPSRGGTEGDGETDGSNAKEESYEDTERNYAQDKLLTGGEIKKLAAGDVDAEELKAVKELGKLIYIKIVKEISTSNLKVA